MKKKRKIWLIILGIVVLAIAAIVIVKLTKSANKELVIRTHVVGEYTVENTVTATGTIEPVETVEVGTQVSGKVEKIYVDFNDVVKKGQLMAELDKQTLNPCQGEPYFGRESAQLRQADIRAYQTAL